MNEIQKIILDIYKEVKKICDKYGITYFAVGGTCIGAVRHNGFIPWDDDIDIAIPIELVDIFLDVMEKELPEYLNIRTGFKDRKSEIIFIKIEDTRTTFIENVEIDSTERYKGVFIDVMPMSGLPSNKIERNVLIAKLRVLFLLNEKKRCNYKACTTIKGKLSWLLIRPICYLVSYDYFLRRYWDVLKKYPFSKCEFVGYTWSRALKRLVFTKDYFKDVVDMPFEDTTMKCPINWDKYLSQQFGDYMKLPTIEMRKSGHEGIVDLQTSYKEYQLQPNKLKKYYDEEEKRW